MEGFKMQCPKCQFENREGVDFCEECGAKFELECPNCEAKIPLERKFCGKCGYALSESKETASPKESEHDTQIPESSLEETVKTEIKAEGERKYVTVLFSDLTGYTALSEKLDPEEVKEITSRIFGEISKIVANYDGFIEKYAGDAVMAIFGIPSAHEDDPIRAVKAAREIHELVDDISPEVERRIGRPISMHTGINTGLVVTGEVDLERGTHGIAGGTINLASRLSNLAKPGEILIDANTCLQAEGYFACEYLEETTVKGKEEPIQVHKVLSQREKPVTIRRLSGLRADLIGRKAELAQLKEAVERLSEGKGSIVSICGDAGTGKSRLVEEFKASLDLGKIRWREGHSYPYSQNIPYFPIMDLMNRAWRIKEDDSPENVREKIEAGIERLLATKENVAPYIGGLYSLSYSETKNLDAESWRSRLFQGIKSIIAALTQHTPTVFCFEDIHWSDPSSLDLLRFIISDPKLQALFLCVHRLPFSLFSSHQLSSLGNLYEEMRLKDFSSSDTLAMVDSLLQTDSIPGELRKFIQTKVEGNPFYVEEAINSLVETRTLIQDDGTWKLTKPLTQTDIPPTVQGVISARLDRLEVDMKRILQEASVIGRAFLRDILIRITILKDSLDQGLHSLEMLDLVRVRSIQPDMEYIFKHALTQEVVYNGLLKKERKDLHESIGLVVEQLFQERLSEFYETLAFHFKRGRSVLKAVDYLTKSAQKSVDRYALEESHKYYQEAFDLLVNHPERTQEKDRLLIDLLLKWAYVFYYRADFGALIELLTPQKKLAESLGDKVKLGMFYAWLGWGIYFKERFLESHGYLSTALEFGKETDDQRLIAYASTWLAWCHMSLGEFDKAIASADRALELSKLFPLDHYLYFKPLGAKGFTYWYKGDKKKTFEIGKIMENFGERHANLRSLCFGRFLISSSYLVEGDFLSALQGYQRTQVSAEPLYYHAGRMMEGGCHLLCGEIQKAFDILEVTLHAGRGLGLEWFDTMVKIFLGVATIAKGSMNKGLNMLEECVQTCVRNKRRYFHAYSEYILGNVYLQIVQGEGDLGMASIIKNIGFLVKNIPFAAKKAENHLNNAIEIAGEIGAKGILAQANFDLGRLHKAKKRKNRAKECMAKAIEQFELCEAETFLAQAKVALESF
jgi:class 3 adenylate cyclase/tetratricopeptide (TPR) repeat protein